MGAKLIVETQRSRDLELRDLCIQGDRAAQLRLFRQSSKKVHAVLYRILGSNQDMEDLVQETFLEVFRALPSYRGDAQLGTWISCICSRVAFGYIKKRRPVASVIDETMHCSDNAPSSDEVADSRAATVRLYTALSKIDAKQRIAFALHVIDGRSMQNVADITESSVSATKSRVLRARKEIAKLAKRDPHLARYLSEQEQVL